MAGDHLDRETSVSAELTENGIKAGAKSRFVAALDRLAGGVVDVLNAHVEAPAQRRRAKTEGEVKLIEAAAQYGVEVLSADPATAQRAFEKHFRKIVREQENSEGVVREALDDLSQNPPNEQANSDQTPLSEEFLDRIEEYGASATTDELRKRWGRVLAAEIRKPGTFSAKVLRVVDELDSRTAIKFEEFARFRIGKTVPKVLTGTLSFELKNSLVSADLLVDPGVNGQAHILFDKPNGSGGSLKFTEFDGVLGIGLPGHTRSGPDTSDGAPLTSMGTQIAIPCHLLTDVGAAIASILKDEQYSALTSYAQHLVDVDRAEWALIYIPVGKEFRPVAELRKR